MVDLLEEIAAPRNLLQAFQHVRAGDLDDGIETPSHSEFMESPFENLDEVASAIRDRTYRPEALRTVVIPKPAGGVRTLHLSQFADGVVERAILQVVSPIVDPYLGDTSHGYRPGLGVTSAVGAVVRSREAGARWIAKGDIQECFDSLSHRMITATLERYLPDPSTVELISRFFTRSASSESPDRGVPQGSALSPLLANLVLERFDRPLAAADLNIVRYADDFVIVCRDRPSAEEALEMAARAAALVDLELSEDKRAIASFKHGFEFLGTQFSRTQPEPRRSTIDHTKPKTLFVTLDGSWIHLKGGHLKVTVGEHEELAVPLERVGRIVTYGAVNLSTWVRDAALRGKFDVTFLSRRGQYRGRLLGADGPRHDLLLAQLEASTSPRRLDFASRIVAGKLANSAALLRRRHDAARPIGLRQTAHQLLTLRDHALRSQSIDELFGIEGTGAREYFEALERLFDADFEFHGRAMRPPPDPINAALSFGYTLLTAECIGACHAVGLEPYLGFLHHGVRRKPALALDLVEEFRSVVVDAIVTIAFNRRSFGPSDFWQEDQRGVRFGNNALRRFLQLYERRMLTEFAHVPSGTKTTYRRALFLQAAQIARWVRGEQASYQPVAWR